MTFAARLHRAIPWLAPPLFALTGLWLAGPAMTGRLLINETQSLPRGLYIRQPAAKPAVGDIVALRQPGAARPYLAGLGVPEDLPLLKRVVAVGGDQACRRGERFTAGVRAATAPALDRRGAALPAWGACRALAAEEVVVLGDTQTSFDSRYFGPIRQSDILGVYERVAPW